jgi:cell division protein ZapA
MSERGESIAVEVAGESFRIRGGSAEEVGLLAEYVNRKLAEIRSRNEGLPLRNLLILTSLNIAEDMFRERREHEILVREVEGRTRRLREGVEEQLIRPTREKGKIPAHPSTRSEGSIS